MSFTIKPSDYGGREEVYYKLTTMCAAFLFRMKKILYVGCRHNDRALVRELKAAGAELDLLEIFPPNAEYFRKYEPDIFRRVIIGDATTYTPDEQYDAIIWWMGPEHAEKKAALEGMDRLKGFCDTLMISVPNGMAIQGAIDGNPNERHISTWTQEELFQLGFVVLAIGEKNGGTLYDFLIGWMRNMNFYKDPEAPIQPHQLGKEFTEVLKAFDNLKPRTVIEIGIQHGGTLYQWMKHMAPGGKIIAIDKFDTGSPIYEWAEKFGHELHLIRGISQSDKVTSKVLEYVKPGEVDFLMIDGDHHYDPARDDYRLYAPLVRKGGVIVLHDITESLRDDQQVNRLWNEIENEKRAVYEYGEDQQMFGTGIVYV